MTERDRVTSVASESAVLVGVMLPENAETFDQLDELQRVAHDMLEEWSRTKRAPRHAAWLHELEFSGE